MSHYKCRDIDYCRVISFRQGSPKILARAILPASEGSGGGEGHEHKKLNLVKCGE